MDEGSRVPRRRAGTCAVCQSCVVVIEQLGKVEVRTSENVVQLGGREGMGLHVGTGGRQQLGANRVQAILFGQARHRWAQLHVLRHRDIVLYSTGAWKDICRTLDDSMRASALALPEYFPLMINFQVSSMGSLVPRGMFRMFEQKISTIVKIER